LLARITTLVEFIGIVLAILPYYYLLNKIYSTLTLLEKKENRITGRISRYINSVEEKRFKKSGIISDLDKRLAEQREIEIKIAQLNSLF
jgi:hypothetical protein